MQYIPIIILCLTIVGLVLVMVWAVCFVMWALFGDLIQHHRRVKEIRKKWRK